MGQQDVRTGMPLEEGLVQDLAGPTQSVLLRLLLYKSVFMGAGFRALAMREESEALSDLLVRFHTDSGAEAAGLALAIREWDAHPASAPSIGEYAEELRRRFLIDVIKLKESVVDTIVAAAMRAPEEPLRRRLLALADVDRRHADALRELLGARTVLAHLRRIEPSEGDAVGAASGRRQGASLSHTIRAEIDELARIGAECEALVLSSDAVRHLRDEGAVDLVSARVFGLPVEIDMGWRGECYSIKTIERVAYAELISAQALTQTDRDTP